MRAGTVDGAMQWNSGEACVSYLNANSEWRPFAALRGFAANLMASAELIWLACRARNVGLRRVGDWLVTVSVEKRPNKCGHTW